MVRRSSATERTIMPRVVVLLIDDDESAQSLQETPPQGAHVIGVFRVPTKFCECSDILIKDGLIKPGEFVRSAKFGWYIHRKCHFPYKGHLHYPKNQLLETRIREGQNLSLTMRFPYDVNNPYTPFGR